MNSNAWVITRINGKVVRFRASSGHLTTDFERAEIFPNADAALPFAHDGDVVQQRSWFALGAAMQPNPSREAA